MDPINWFCARSTVFERALPRLTIDRIIKGQVPTTELVMQRHAAHEKGSFNIFNLNKQPSCLAEKPRSCRFSPIFCDKTHHLLRTRLMLEDRSWLPSTTAQLDGTCWLLIPRFEHISGKVKIYSKPDSLVWPFGDDFNGRFRNLNWRYLP